MLRGSKLIFLDLRVRVEVEQQNIRSVRSNSFQHFWKGEAVILLNQYKMLPI